MRECRTYGSVRGAPGNGRPYRDSHAVCTPFRTSAGYPREKAGSTCAVPVAAYLGSGRGRVKVMIILESMVGATGIEPVTPAV
jgi:hypothetical protein